MFTPFVRWNKKSVLGERQEKKIGFWGGCERALGRTDNVTCCDGPCVEVPVNALLRRLGS